MIFETEISLLVTLQTHLSVTTAITESLSFMLSNKSPGKNVVHSLSTEA